MWNEMSGDLMAKFHGMRSSAHSCPMNSNILHHFIAVLIEKSRSEEHTSELQSQR